MRSAKAIFIKQMRDIIKNPTISIQFILFPVMALILTLIVALPNEEIPNNMYTAMFGAMFAGMGPLTATAGAIAEDREHKSLRLLVMAGVKPHEYLLGLGGFILFVSAVSSVFFALIGDFSIAERLIFISILIFGSATSVLLGATVGIFSKNQQAATSLSVPVSLIMAFMPMLGMFNETISKVSGVLFTQQISKIAEDISISEFSASSAVKPLLIILSNFIVFLVLFVVAYKRKGLKD